MSNCNNHNMVFVRRTKIDGTILVNKQCMECGEHDARAYKKELLPADAPLFDEQKKEQLYIINKQKENDIQREIYIQERESIWEPDKIKWFKDVYDPYLKTEKWHKKRDLVLKRDNYICQACLKNKANQAHHLTYQNVLDEPLFDLISVCKPCHDKIHIKKYEKYRL